MNSKPLNGLDWTGSYLYLVLLTWALDWFTKNFFWNFKMCIANSMEDYHSGQLAKKSFPQMLLLHKVLAKNGQKMVKKGQK